MQILSKKLDAGTRTWLEYNTTQAGMGAVHHRAERSHVPEANKHLAEIFDKGVVKSKEPAKDDRWAPEADMNIGIAPKKVFKADSTAGTHRFLVKPYFDSTVRGHPSLLGGWAEMTSQALYHAGGIGHMHQKVHVAQYRPRGQTNEYPMLAIHLEHEHNVVSNIRREDRKGFHATNPEFKNDIRKLVLMDFLSGNSDRHEGNLMVSNAGRPLAIDNAYAFGYDPDREYLHESLHTAHTKNAHNWLDTMHTVGGDRQAEMKRYGESLRPALDWWKTAGGQIRKQMQVRLGLIKNEETRATIEANFNQRADHLDGVAEGRIPWDKKVRVVDHTGAEV